MSYKSRLGITDYIFNKEVDHYFEKLGFYQDTMNPQFLDDYDYAMLKVNEPCLRIEADWNEGGMQRVFMNGNEIYVERQTNYRRFDSCSQITFKNPPTSIEVIEKHLEELIWA